MKIVGDPNCDSGPLKALTFSDLPSERKCVPLKRIILKAESPTDVPSPHAKGYKSTPISMIFAGLCKILFEIA